MHAQGKPVVVLSVAEDTKRLATSGILGGSHSLLLPPGFKLIHLGQPASETSYHCKVTKVRVGIFNFSDYRGGGSFLGRATRLG